MNEVKLTEKECVSRCRLCFICGIAIGILLVFLLKELIK